MELVCSLPWAPCLSGVLWVSASCAVEANVLTSEAFSLSLDHNSLKVCILSGPTPCYEAHTPSFLGEAPQDLSAAPSSPVAAWTGAACPSKPASACSGTSWLDQTCHLQQAEKVLHGARHQPHRRLHPPLFTTHVVETREEEGSATPASCTPRILTPRPAHPTSRRQSSGLVPWPSHGSCESGDLSLRQCGRCNRAQAGTHVSTHSLEARLSLAVWRLSPRSGASRACGRRGPLLTCRRPSSHCGLTRPREQALGPLFLLTRTPIPSWGSALVTSTHPNLAHQGCASHFCTPRRPGAWGSPRSSDEQA